MFDGSKRMDLLLPCQLKGMVSWVVVWGGFSHTCPRGVVESPLEQWQSSTVMSDFSGSRQGRGQGDHTQPGPRQLQSELNRDPGPKHGWGHPR